MSDWHPVLQLLAIFGMLCLANGILFAGILWLAFRCGFIDKDPF